MNLSDTTGETYSHIGIIVHDLEAAVERFSTALSLRFTAPITRESKMTDGSGRDVSMPFRLAYGLDGPPHYELIQVQPDGGYYGSQHGEGFHHVGMWATDIETAVGEFRRAGVEPELTLSRVESGGVTAVYFAPGTVHGVRLELVDGSLREGFLELLSRPGAIR